MLPCHRLEAGRRSGRRSPGGGRRGPAFSSQAAAGKTNVRLTAPACLWAGEVAMSVPVWLLAALVGSGAIESEVFAELTAPCDSAGARDLQAGRLAARDFVARPITV